MAQTIKKSSSWDESERRSISDTARRPSGAPSNSFGALTSLAPPTIEEAFPDVDPNYIPLGSLVLIQIMVSRAKTEGGIELTEDYRRTIQENTQIGRMVAYGPLAYKNRNTGADWPEGAWVKAGEFVRVPRLGGDRFEVKYGDGVVQFLVMKDLELAGKIPRPLEAIAYV